MPCSIPEGPEFGTEEDWIFIGMVTEDVDISQLVDTIADLGRDIEESGRVTAVVLCNASNAIVGKTARTEGSQLFLY